MLLNRSDILSSFLTWTTYNLYHNNSFFLFHETTMMMRREELASQLFRSSCTAGSRWTREYLWWFRKSFLTYCRRSLSLLSGQIMILYWSFLIFCHLSLQSFSNSSFVCSLWSNLRLSSMAIVAVVALALLSTDSPCLKAFAIFLLTLGVLATASCREMSTYVRSILSEAEERTRKAGSSSGHACSPSLLASECGP